MDHHDAKLHEDIGYIKGIVEGIDKKVEKQNGAIVDLTKKVAKHDVVIGKVGVMITGVVFVVTTIFNIGAQWIKMKFLP